MTEKDYQLFGTKILNPKTKEIGLVGAFTGGTAAAAGGIAAAVFFGYIASLISKPKMKKQ